MAPKRKDVLPVTKNSLFFPSLTASHLAPPFLLPSSPPHKDAKLTTEDERPHPERAQQLLSLAILHIPVSLVLQLPPFPAHASSLRTKNQFLRLPFRIFLERGLHALRVYPFVRQILKQILIMSHVLSLPKQVKADLTDDFDKHKVVLDICQKALEEEAVAFRAMVSPLDALRRQVSEPKAENCLSKYSTMSSCKRLFQAFRKTLKRSSIGSLQQFPRVCLVFL